MFKLFRFLIIIFTFTNCQLFVYNENINDEKFSVVYEWQTIKFLYRNLTDHQRAIRIGEYIDRNILISDVKAFANRLYLTMPRLLNGVPATLGWIISPDGNGRTDPLIEPFPSWEYNREGDCRAMQFVQGIEIDGTGLMWVVDSGRSQILVQDKSTVICVPKLLILDLKSNGTVIHIYEFPEKVAERGKNYLSKIVIDDFMHGFAYITDNSISDPGIVVYSRNLNRSWKVREFNTMRSSDDATHFTINGTNIKFSIHINGIALGPYFNPNTGDTVLPKINTPTLINENYERNVYYSPLSSYHLYSIPASKLRDPLYPLITNQIQLTKDITDYGVKTSQSDGMIMDNHGILYYSLLQKHAIAKWNSSLQFMKRNQKIIARDKLFIHWTDGMAFDQNGNLFIVVNRLYHFLTKPLNPNEVNFRILKAKINARSYVFTKDVLSLLPNNSFTVPDLSNISSQIIFNIWNIIIVIIIVRKLC